ncbi:MAG: metal ABC transporter permease [Anaerolineaceae bacterium]|nr:metal ABC transporter permease [Anaerolineaceae bacterium]
MDWLTWLEEPLRFALFQRSLLALSFIGVLSGVVGSFVVVRDVVFLGEALGHSLTPGVALALLLGVDVTLGGFVTAIVAVLVIFWLSQYEGLNEHSAIGIVMSAMFALGVAIISRTSSFQIDVVHLLFGSPLGISVADLQLSIALGAIVILVVIALFKELQLISFDPNWAESANLPARNLHALLLILIAMTVVASLRTLGVGLFLAMLVTPATTARILTKRLRDMVWLAALFGMMSGLIGFYIAYYFALPTASAVALTAFIFLGIALLRQQWRIYRAHS